MTCQLAVAALQPGDGYLDLELQTTSLHQCWVRITGRAYFNDLRAHRFVGTAQQQGEGEVALVVRDSSVGIPAEFLPSVFERFRQADAGHARAFGGLGLGLSIVRHLPRSRLDGLRILAVDDNPEAVDVMRHLREHRGAQVTVATSAERVLNELPTLRPHLLISDVGMPEVDGLELVHRVRARNIDVPAIAVTAYARPEDIQRAVEAGCDAHAPKPIDWDQLVETIVSVSPPPLRPTAH